MDVILFSIKLNEICARLKTNGLKDDFEILEYFSGEDFFAVFNLKVCGLVTRSLDHAELL